MGVSLSEGLIDATCITRHRGSGSRIFCLVAKATWAARGEHSTAHEAAAPNRLASVARSERLVIGRSSISLSQSAMNGVFERIYKRLAIDTWRIHDDRRHMCALAGTALVRDKKRRASASADARRTDHQNPRPGRRRSAIRSR